MLLDYPQIWIIIQNLDTCSHYHYDPSFKHGLQSLICLCACVFSPSSCFLVCSSGPVHLQLCAGAVPVGPGPAGDACQHWAEQRRGECSPPPPPPRPHSRPHQHIQQPVCENTTGTKRGLFCCFFFTLLLFMPHMELL